MKKDRWPNCIRYKDTVKVVKPVFVTRVGYPKIADDFMEEAERTLIQKDLIRPFPQHRFRGWSVETRNRPYDETVFIRKYARLLLKRAGWGGNQRTLHTYEAPDFLDKELIVRGKRVFQTGGHVGPTSHASNGWDGVDHDYDPGGLSDRKTHILLWCSVPGCFYIGIEEQFPQWPWLKDRHLVIPAANVVKLSNGSQD